MRRVFARKTLAFETFDEERKCGGCLLERKYGGNPPMFWYMHMKICAEKDGASEGIRTLDIHLGKVTLYQTELRSHPHKCRLI